MSDLPDFYGRGDGERSTHTVNLTKYFRPSPPEPTGPARAIGEPPKGGDRSALRTPIGLTTDPTEPRLGHGIDLEPGMNDEAYLILSEHERAKGFVRPVRAAYFHVGARPTYATRKLTRAESKAHKGMGYVLYEPYPETEHAETGRFWTQKQLDSGCFDVALMPREIAETCARDPGFYGAAYCPRCRMHLPIEEFIWFDQTPLGS